MKHGSKPGHFDPEAFVEDHEWTYARRCRRSPTSTSFEERDSSWGAESGRASVSALDGAPIAGSGTTKARLARGGLPISSSSRRSEGHSGGPIYPVERRGPDRR